MKKRTCHAVDFTVLSDHGMKIKENKKLNKITVSCLDAEKALKNEGDDNANCSWSRWNDPQIH